MVVSLHDLPCTAGFQGESGSVGWDGYVVEEEEDFRKFLVGPVAARLRDDEMTQQFTQGLAGLATTGMSAAFLTELLSAQPPIRSWEVGEALAEAILKEDANREVTWPWNHNRDKRTPRAILPGADLVGFCRDETGVALLFGEVKTSADSNCPPGVMNGKAGMTWQLKNTAGDLAIQNTLLMWLCARCLTPSLRELYESAVSRFLTSEGKDFVMVGVLLRDTECNELDVKARAAHLASEVAQTTRVEIMVWYIPTAISEWASIVESA